MSLQLGAFARIWRRGSAGAIAQAMAGEGLTVAQWNFSALGLPTIDAHRTAEEHERVRGAFQAAGVEVWGLSASFNLIEPDLAERRRLVEGACRMIGIAGALGVTAVTVLTGSRSDDGYSFDPRNREPDAWEAMLRALEPLLAAAQTAGMLIGVEPEGGNVVRDARCGLRLFDEFGADAPIGFIIDPWNLVEGDLLPGARQRSAEVVVAEAFELLGSRAICLQAKDPLGLQYPQFGLDYRQVAQCHSILDPRLPVVIQDVEEADIPRVVRELRAVWSRPAGQQSTAEATY
ncbi:sugar phosphate isomerase/epimerase family protein [Microbacterium sp.]|uniref:sugar phosphate isomerase/epimerase family protein n=1 Tax=Microbacterium sp. TaxID=51671 RepID=UPI0039E4802D